MRRTHVRLLAMRDVALIDPQHGPIPHPAPGGDAVQLGAVQPAVQPGLADDAGIDKPAELGWWDWTVFLLHTAAEIEHALLVQYLYAAYCLNDRDFTGPAVPPDAVLLTAQWRQTLVGIAKEEMAHLLTVQNLLRFLGGPVTLAREDFPYQNFLYPFPLRLEPLTRTSLAKYVAAEMPAAPDQPAALIDEIVTRAEGAVSGVPINRVGRLYATLGHIVADPDLLPDADLAGPAGQADQADPSDWLGFGPLIVRSISSRADAVAALHAVGEQGEGPEHPRPGSPPSHFDRFLQLYLAFPEPDGPTGWVPTRSVPSDPNTLPVTSGDPELESGRITHPGTLLWAHLCNVRYRMLLVDLVHALRLPGPTTQDGEPTPKGHLRDWAFQEMRGQSLAGLRGIAARLTTLPLKREPAPTDARYAAAPFELPYTLDLPDDERARWRLHRALLDTSQHLISEIQAGAPEPDPLLAELAAIDGQARTVVDAQLA